MWSPRTVTIPPPDSMSSQQQSHQPGCRADPYTPELMCQSKTAPATVPLVQWGRSTKPCPSVPHRSRTCTAGGDVDLGVLLARQRAHGRDAIEGRHADGVVDVRQQVHQGDGAVHQPCLLRHKAHAAVALLAAVPQCCWAPATPQAVGQVVAATCVSGGTPLQHQ